MARRKVERQMRLFGVGDLGPLDDDDGDAGSGVSDDESGRKSVAAWG